MLYSTSIGLDVHARSISAAAFVFETGEVAQRTFGYDPDAVAAWAATLPQPAGCLYESGPTGFDLQRRLVALGLPRHVGAVSKMVRPSGDRVKTDRRDALFLSRLLAVGEFVECAPPTPAMEAARDLSRAREDAREALMRARHQLSKFLPGKGHVWPRGRSTWTRAHREWLRSIELDDPCERAGQGVRGAPRPPRLGHRREVRRRRPRRRHLQAPRPARRLDRHRLRDRRRDRRLLPLRQPQGAHVLRRPRAVGVVVGRDDLEGRDHQDRQLARQAAPRRGRLAPRQAPVSGLRDRRGLVGGAPGGGGGDCGAGQPQAAPQVPRPEGEGEGRQRRQRRRRPRARRVLLGARPLRAGRRAAKPPSRTRGAAEARGAPRDSTMRSEARPRHARP